MAEPIASRKRNGSKRSPLYRFGKKLRPLVNRQIARSSKVGDPPVFDPDLFTWTHELTARWESIRDEARAVLESRRGAPPLSSISPDHRRIADAEKWRSFFLWGYGYRIDANCARCPQTEEALQHVPGLNSAFFSILAPGTHIPRHTGVTKRIITCHLGLITPTPNKQCRIEVDDQTLVWHDGRCIAFDDTYPHEVWNDTDGTRVVLLIQFARPLRQPGRLIGDAFLGAVRRSPFVQEARRNLQEWEERSDEPDAHRVAER